MEINSISVEKATDINIPENLIFNSIKKYISDSHYPIKSEVRRMEVTKEYIKEKMKNTEAVLSQADHEYQMISMKTTLLNDKCLENLSRLRKNLMN